MTNIVGLVYDVEGNFLGYTNVKRGKFNKLASSNIWTEENKTELTDLVSKLNDSTNLQAYWPRMDDPDVLKLLEDPTWEPIETKEESVLDGQNSYLVYTHANPDGSPTQASEIDWEASAPVYKTARVAVRPSDASLRQRKAFELVARARAEEAANG